MRGKKLCELHVFMAALAALLLANVVRADEPVICSDYNIQTVSVVEVKAIDLRIDKRENRSGLFPLDWYVEYATTAKLKPVRTLRGQRVTSTLLLAEQCSAGWLDVRGRKACSEQITRNKLAIVWVDNRRLSEAGLVNDPLHRYDREIRDPDPLPSCEYGA